MARAWPAARLLLAQLLVALPSLPAVAQQGDWRAAAPRLPLEGAVRPLTAPLDIGGTAWGPWRSICREQTMRPGSPPQRDCLAVAEAKPEPVGMRLTLVQERTGLRMSMVRRADGRVGDFSALRADGTAPPADEARDAVLASWRDQFATLSLGSRRISARQVIELPVAGSTRGMPCRVEGTGTLPPRQVVVAICGIEMAGTMGSASVPIEVQIAARIAVDVATGMVINQSYATRIERFSRTPDGQRTSVGAVVTPSRVILE